MSTNPTLVSDTEILAQVIGLDGPGWPEQVAQVLLDLRFPLAALQCMDELAEKNRLGILSPLERAQLDSYLRVGNFLNLIQAKARLSLAKRRASPE
jgi:hypothetical protein